MSFFAEYPKISIIDLEIMIEDHIYDLFYYESFDEKNLNDLSATKMYFKNKYNHKKWEGFLEDLFDYIEHSLGCKTDQQVYDMPKESIEKLYKFIKG